MLLAAIPSASAAPIVLDWASGNPNLVYGPNSVSQTVNGVTVTASGLAVVFDAASSVYGPFPTSSGIGANQIFGADTSGAIGQSGLGLLTQAATGIPPRVSDFGCGVYQPGVDSQPTCVDTIPASEFLLFSFSESVDVSAIVVDDVSNFDRDIWAAGGTRAPDFSDGFHAAFAPFTVVNSDDDGTDGLFFARCRFAEHHVPCRSLSRSVPSVLSRPARRSSTSLAFRSRPRTADPTARMVTPCPGRRCWRCSLSEAGPQLPDAECSRRRCSLPVQPPTSEC